MEIDWKEPPEQKRRRRPTNYQQLRLTLKENHGRWARVSKALNDPSTTSRWRRYGFEAEWAEAQSDSTKYDIYARWPEKQTVEEAYEEEAAAEQRTEEVEGDIAQQIRDLRERLTGTSEPEPQQPEAEAPMPPAIPPWRAKRKDAGIKRGPRPKKLPADPFPAEPAARLSDVVTPPRPLPARTVPITTRPTASTRLPGETEGQFLNRMQRERLEASRRARGVPPGGNSIINGIPPAGQR
jgi:hypothetical protein